MTGPCARALTLLALLLAACGGGSSELRPTPEEPAAAPDARPEDPGPAVVIRPGTVRVASPVEAEKDVAALMDLVEVYARAIDGPDRWPLVDHVARLFIEARRPVEVRRMTILAPWDRFDEMASLLGEAARVAAQQGRTMDARLLAARLDEMAGGEAAAAGHPILARAEAARARARSGDAAKATEDVREIEAALAGEKDPAVADEVRAILAMAKARLGDTAGALALASRVQAGQAREHALADAAVAISLAGDTPRALAELAKVAAVERELALITLADRLLVRSRFAEATDVALALARQGGDAWGQVRRVERLATEGQPLLAQRLAGALGGARWQAEAWIRVGEQAGSRAAQREAFDKAGRLADTVPVAEERLLVLDRLARAWQGFGDAEAARRAADAALFAAEKEQDPAARATLLAHVGATKLATGEEGAARARLEEARRLALAVTPPGRRAAVAVQVAGALGRAGLAAEALALLDEAAASRLETGLVRVAEGLAATGQSRGLLLVAARMVAEGTSPQAVERVLGEMAAAGLHEDALAVVADELDRARRASWLGRIAATVASTLVPMSGKARVRLAALADEVRP